MTHWKMQGNTEQSSRQPVEVPEPWCHSLLGELDSGSVTSTATKRASCQLIQNAAVEMSDVLVTNIQKDNVKAQNKAITNR